MRPRPPRATAGRVETFQNSTKPGQRGRIPAAALTAYARAEDRVRALQTGYQTHVPKPVEPAELEVVVATLARSFKRDD